MVDEAPGATAMTDSGSIGRLDFLFFPLFFLSLFFPPLPSIPLAPSFGFLLPRPFLPLPLLDLSPFPSPSPPPTPSPSPSRWWVNELKGVVGIHWSRRWKEGGHHVSSYVGAMMG